MISDKWFFMILFYLSIHSWRCAGGVLPNVCADTLRYLCKKRVLHLLELGLQACMCRHPQKQEEGVRSFSAGVTGNCELPHMGDGNYPVLIKQQVVITLKQDTFDIQHQWAPLLISLEKPFNFTVVDIVILIRSFLFEWLSLISYFS